MASNVTIPATGTGSATPLVSTEEVTTLNAGAVTAQQVQRLIMALRTATATAIDLPGDAANGLDVDVTRLPAVTNAGTFAVQDSEKLVDNAAFTDGTSKLMMAGYIYDEVAGTGLSENDAAAPRIDVKRATIGVIEDATTRGQRASVSASGALKTALPLVKVSVTPTISNSPAYAATDQMGGVMTFSSVVAANGYSGRVVNAVMTNRQAGTPPMECWLFRNSPTMVNSDNGTFDMTDANMEAAEIIGMIDFGSYYTMTSSATSMGSRNGVPLSMAPLPFICGASLTAIYGVLVVRTTPTMSSTTDLVVTLTVEQL